MRRGEGQRRVVVEREGGVRVGHLGVEEVLGQVEGEREGAHEGARERQARPPVRDHGGREVRDRRRLRPGEAPVLFSRPFVFFALFFFLLLVLLVPRRAAVRLDAEELPDARREGLERGHGRVAARVVRPREGLAVVDRLGRVDALCARRLVAVEVGRLARVGAVLDGLRLPEEGEAARVRGVGHGGGNAVVPDVEEAVVGRRRVDLPRHRPPVRQRGAEDAGYVDDGDLGRGCVARRRALDGAVDGPVARGELQLEGLAAGLGAGIRGCFLDGHFGIWRSLVRSRI